jgi:hypothetical protein
VSMDWNWLRRPSISSAGRLRAMICGGGGSKGLGVWVGSRRRAARAGSRGAAQPASSSARPPAAAPAAAPAAHLHGGLLQPGGLGVLLHALQHLEAQRQRGAGGGAAAQPGVPQHVLRAGALRGVLDLRRRGRASGRAQAPASGRCAALAGQGGGRAGARRAQASPACAARSPWPPATRGPSRRP